MDMWMDVDTALAEVPVNLMPLVDSTDFTTIEAAVAFNASGMDLRWNFVTTDGAFTSTPVTPTSGGDYDWAGQGDGMYTIGMPASGGASINNDTEGFGWFSGVATGVLPWRGPVIGFRAAGLNDALIDSAYSTTRGLAGTALPNAAADAAGGLPVSDAGGLDLDAQVGTKINSILADTGTDGVVVASGSKTGYDLNADQSGVTVGTVTTVTNLTNAPTAGDLTATMKASVTTAATAATPTAAAVTGAVGSVTGGVGGNVTGSVGSLAAQAKADVNAEVLDVLNTDTFAEPGQGAPAATTTLVEKIGFLFKAWRNKTTQTSSEYALFADDGTTKDQEAAVSDDGSTTTRGEVTTGA